MSQSSTNLECIFFAQLQFSFKLQKKLGSLRSGSLTSVPGGNTEHILLEFISKYVNGKKVIGSTQHNFAKGKCSSTELMKWPSFEGEDVVGAVIVLLIVVDLDGTSSLPSCCDITRKSELWGMSR